MDCRRSLDAAPHPCVKTNRNNVSIVHVTSDWNEAERSAWPGPTTFNHLKPNARKHAKPEKKETTFNLSPVRWSDKQHDGIYLNRSGWVQVHTGSLDEYQSHKPRRHDDKQPRPVFLPLNFNDHEPNYTTTNIPSPRSPITSPIISPPLAFQDPKTNAKPRYYFGDEPTCYLNKPREPERYLDVRPVLQRSVGFDHSPRNPSSKSVDVTATSKLAECPGPSWNTSRFCSLDSCKKFQQVYESSMESSENVSDDGSNSSTSNCRVNVTSHKRVVTPVGVVVRSKTLHHSSSSSSSDSPQSPHSKPRCVRVIRQTQSNPIIDQNISMVRRSRSLQLPESRVDHPKPDRIVPKKKNMRNFEYAMKTFEQRKNAESRHRRQCSPRSSKDRYSPRGASSREPSPRERGKSPRERRVRKESPRESPVTRNTNRPARSPIEPSQISPRTPSERSPNRTSPIRRSPSGRSPSGSGRSPSGSGRSPSDSGRSLTRISPSVRPSTERSPNRPDAIGRRFWKVNSYDRIVGVEDEEYRAYIGNKLTMEDGRSPNYRKYSNVSNNSMSLPKDLTGDVVDTTNAWACQQKVASENTLYDACASVTSSATFPKQHSLNAAESVLEKFRKTFSLRFNQNRKSKSFDTPHASSFQGSVDTKGLKSSVAKSRFDRWRSEKGGSKKGSSSGMNRRSMDSGDSGIQVETDIEDHNPTKTNPNKPVRRTNSDTTQCERHYTPSPSPVRMHKNMTPSTLVSPSIVLRMRRQHMQNRAVLRRSLSQPVDIDKISPKMSKKITALNLAATHSTHSSNCNTPYWSDDEPIDDVNQPDCRITVGEALWDHVTLDADELEFKAGDTIRVLDRVDRDWWWGATADNNFGWFPASFIRLRVNQDDCQRQPNDVTPAISDKTDKNRASVVLELINSEREYVRTLRDIVSTLIACRTRADLFTPEQLQAIFVNVEELLDFQSRFLHELETCVDWTEPYLSRVGECFLKHQAGFRIYSDYCNSHPTAVATLQDLTEQIQYCQFFDALKSNKQTPEIPLHGHLLTPVQRICKYPLQLAELIKYTKPEHADSERIREALTAMRHVAILINERKRRMESLEKLAAWQQRVEGWHGSDLIDTSSQLIFQGEVIRVTSGLWTNWVMLFLFDRQIVYCKKDILKRSTYVYKGRICLDSSAVIDVPDGKESQFNVTVKNCIKIQPSDANDSTQPCLLFCCRTQSDKQKWLSALALERKLVNADQLDGFTFHATSKMAARMVAKRTTTRPPSKKHIQKNYKRTYNGSLMNLNVDNGGESRSSGKRLGAWWFAFSAIRKHNSSKEKFYST